MLANRGVNARLTIIGDQDNDKKYAEEMRTLVKEKDLESRVSFLGRVSEEELVAGYQNNHIFIFANDPQTWGLAVFEAMACGTPVIVSRGAGAHEVLTDRENALLISPRAPQDIAAAVELLVSDGAFYTALSRNGRAFVEKNIGWKKYADGMERLCISATTK